MLAFITFVLLATFPGWHVETNREGSDVDVKPFPSRPVSQAALAFVFIASVFVLVCLFLLLSTLSSFPLSCYSSSFHFTTIHLPIYPNHFACTALPSPQQSH